MVKLFELIYRSKIFILFLFFQIIAISISRNKNKDRFIESSSDSFSSSVDLFSNGISSYFHLSKINSELAIENQKLKNKLERCQKFEHNIDSIDLKYRYINAKVINNSILKSKNYITLNKGSNSGIKPGMAVINHDGVVGVTVRTSPNYTKVISVLNTKSRVSAKLKNKLEFGTITWNARSFRKLQLNEIPNHITVYKGDTILTNGYSATFPESTMIGIVESVENKSGQNFLSIELKPSVDYSSLNYVYVVSNKNKKEQIELENAEN